MPLYDYRCADGHVFEVIHGLHEDGPHACPECGKPCERQISAPGVVKSRGRFRKDIKVRRPGESINLSREEDS